MNQSKRKYPPRTSLPETLNYTAPEKLILPNGLNLYLIRAGELDLSRLSVYHRAGTKYQSKTLVASTVVAQLSEGIHSPERKMDAYQIAESWDYMGSIYDTNIDRDFSQQSIYSLNRQFEASVSLFHDTIFHPGFPEESLQTYNVKQREQLILQNERSEYQARKAYMAALYGSDSPYGHSAEPDDYLHLNASDLNEFHRAFYTKPTLVLAGKISDKHLQYVMDLFGRPHPESQAAKPSMYAACSNQQQKTGYQYIQRTDAAQASLRMGRLLFNKQHPDFLGMQVLSTILGGYFGSRLMKNIREEKGYTYGVYSGLSSMEESGMFTISAEIGNEYVEDSLREIHKEIKKLQTEPVDESELSMVRNFMVGDLLRTVDGAWNLAEIALETLQSGQHFDFPHEVFDRIKNIGATEIMELAQKYLNPEDMIELIVGSNK